MMILNEASFGHRQMFFGTDFVGKTLCHIQCL